MRRALLLLVAPAVVLGFGLSGSALPARPRPVTSFKVASPNPGDMTIVQFVVQTKGATKPPKLKLSAPGLPKTTGVLYGLARDPKHRGRFFGAVVIINRKSASASRSVRRVASRTEGPIVLVSVDQRFAAFNQCGIGSDYLGYVVQAGVTAFGTYGIGSDTRDMTMGWISKYNGAHLGLDWRVRCGGGLPKWSLPYDSPPPTPINVSGINVAGWAIPAQYEHLWKSGVGMATGYYEPTSPEFAEVAGLMSFPTTPVMTAFKVSLPTAGPFRFTGNTAGFTGFACTTPDPATLSCTGGRTSVVSGRAEISPNPTTSMNVTVSVSTDGTTFSKPAALTYGTGAGPLTLQLSHTYTSDVPSLLYLCGNVSGPAGAYGTLTVTAPSGAQASAPFTIKPTGLAGFVTRIPGTGTYVVTAASPTNSVTASYPVPGPSTPQGPLKCK